MNSQENTFGMFFFFNSVDLCDLNQKSLLMCLSVVSVENNAILLKEMCAFTDLYLTTLHV